ncbi:MAG: hypothetical protein ACRDKT_02145 [Actinomycetota bacterium]
MSDDRVCTWLAGGGRIVSIPRSTWWLALTRGPAARRYRSRYEPPRGTHLCRTDKKGHPLI